MEHYHTDKCLLPHPSGQERARVQHQEKMCWLLWHQEPELLPGLWEENKRKVPFAPTPEQQTPGTARSWMEPSAPPGVTQPCKLSSSCVCWLCSFPKHPSTSLLCPISSFPSLLEILSALFLFPGCDLSHNNSSMEVAKPRFHFHLLISKRYPETIASI